MNKVHKLAPTVMSPLVFVNSHRLGLQKRVALPHWLIELHFYVTLPRSFAIELVYYSILKREL